MSAVLKKGAPSRSYPSRQRKLGPAPFASFEDLSDEMESPGGAEEGNKVDVMPEIKEDRMNERAAGAAGGYQSPIQSYPGCGGGEEETPVAVRSHRNVTATSSSSTVTFAASQSAPTSGPTSGLQTPSTPRIDISCASSSTPPSDESSEKELFQGGLGFAFHEEAVEDLRSSTEELDLEEEEISSEEERRRKRLEEQEMREQDIYRRSSHPANIFTRKSSCPAAPPPPVDDQQRKPSAHSLFLEGLLNRPCRHASFGHGDYIRSGAVSSLSTHSAGSGMRSRSPSPHKMLFETSFCGNKPIPTKSMDVESPPKDKDNAAVAPIPGPSPKLFSHGGSFHSYSTPQSAHVSAVATPTTSARFGISDDSRSLKSPKKMVITPSWERQSELEQVCSQVVGPKDIDSVSRTKTPLSPQPSSLGFDSRRPSTGRRSVSPHKMLLETSFCGNKPIPTRSMEAESPPKDLPDLSSLLAECSRLAGTNASGSNSQVNAHCHKTVTAQVHRHSTPGDRSSIISKDDDQFQTPVQRKSDAGQYPLGGGGDLNAVPYLPGSPESPKSSDLWQPISPRMELRSPAFSPSSTSSQQPPQSPRSDSVRDKREDAGSFTPTSSTPQGHKPEEGPSSSSANKLKENSHPPTTSSNSTSSAVVAATTKQYNQDQFNDPGSSATKEIARSSSIKTGPSGGAGKSVGFQSEKSESSRDHDDDDGEITTEMKISEDPTVTVEDVPIESKGLFFQSDSFDEEGDLPYVPTTLPQEKSTGVSIIPVSERKKMALMLTTTPVQRPKVNRPAAPASLTDYIEYSKNSLPKTRKDSGVGAGDDTTGEDGGEGITKMKINLPREDSLGKSGGHRKSLPTTTWTDFAHMGLRSPREIRRKMKEENGAVDDISSYHSDSSSTNDIPGVVDGAPEEETESLLKLPKVPFAMDLDVHSNRSSVISQDEVQKSPSECSALLGSPDNEPDSSSKKSDSHDLT